MLDPRKVRGLLKVFQEFGFEQASVSDGEVTVSVTRGGTAQAVPVKASPGRPKKAPEHALASLGRTPPVGVYGEAE